MSPQTLFPHKQCPNCVHNPPPIPTESESQEESLVTATQELTLSTKPAEMYGAQSSATGTREMTGSRGSHVTNGLAKRVWICSGASEGCCMHNDLFTGFDEFKIVYPNGEKPVCKRCGRKIDKECDIVDGPGKPGSGYIDPYPNFNPTYNSIGTDNRKQY
jgi:hypothetical protein